MCKVCLKDNHLKINDKIILKRKDWNKNNPEKNTTESEKI